ncbi:MAG: phosphatase PAP2 family protein [Patescibacteria group bacterium]|mgnify:CR=1 FL=1
MLKNLARLISLLSSPFVLFLPTPFILVFKETGNISYSLKWTFFSYIFLFSVIFFVLLGMLVGFFSDYDVSKKEERPKLFAFVGIITFLYLGSLILLNGPKVLYLIIFGIILGVFTISLVNNWIKASIHTATVSAFTLSLVILFGYMFIPILLLIPAMAWARVKIKKHTPLETLAGGFLGVILTIIVYMIGRFIL